MLGKPSIPARQPAGQGFQLYLLGGFRCALNGHAVEGAWYDKMRALLAYLAVQRDQAHPRERLAELLWSGSDPVIARGNLRRTLSDLRRVLELPLGEPAFLATRPTIRFMPDARIDAVELGAAASPASTGPETASQRSERLAELYSGEFMAGFHLPDCPEFEGWLLVQREALHRHALALLEPLANAHDPRGDHGKALKFALRYVDLEPWDDAAHRRVMRLHALSGQKGAALAQFDTCRRVLAEALGIAPSAETQLLAERIRRGESLGASPPLAVPPVRADRRQVSVLCCELAASTVDDPDDAVEHLMQPQAHCAAIIRRFAGHLVPLHGGGLLAYFGYPLSHEDSAVRAVRAALAVTRSATQGIEIRSGVHTGLILTGADPALPDVLGKTSAVAIELRHSAGYGEAVISEVTLGIVTGYFDCAPLRVQSLSEAGRPMAVFRVDKERPARTRLDAASQLTPLIGRQAELAMLEGLWRQAEQGARPAVLLQGEAGIGKSRLVHAFKQRLQGQPHAVRELRCFPETSQSPFHPVRALLEADLGLAAGDIQEMKAAQLAQHVAAAYPELAPEAIAPLASLYAVPPADAYVVSDLPPPNQKALTIEILRRILQRQMAGQAVLLIADDLHWADPSTLELLAVLAQRQGTGGLLLVLTARPGFVPPFAAAVASLAPLAPPEMAQLIASVGGGVSAEIVRRIVERADGIPLFAEELAKTAARDDWSRIPGTLHDVLAVRMDRLGAAKHIAQMAATIGRQFDLHLLRALCPGGPDVLEPGLVQLKDAGLIEPVDEATCQFRHALIQEAAYQSQSRADQRAAHRQIARALRSDFADSVAARPERLAQHWALAGESAQAIGCWVEAGQLAIRGSANLEGLAHFRCALTLLTAQPEAPERDQAEFSILVGLCPALHATQGYGSEEATAVAARLSALRVLVGDSPDRFQAEWTRLRNAIATVGPLGVPQAAMRLASLVRDDPIRLQAAHYVAAVASFWLGEFEASRAHAAQAIALYRAEQHPMMLALFGEDLSASFAGHLSWALCFLGHTDQARSVCARMLEQARKMAHPKTLAMALLFASMLPRWSNQHAETLAVSAEAIAVTRQLGLSHWLATSEVLHAWARVMQDGSQDLSALQALAAGLRAASPSYSALGWATLAELHLRMGHDEGALAALAQAQASEALSGNCQFAAERHRLTGVCLLARLPPDERGAEAAFAEALAISRAQAAKALELRAAMSLARLWHRQGRRDQARHLLATAHAWFTDGFETPDLAEAAALLRAWA